MTIREHQTSEFKLVWKDEYLKHICAFSNAKGGNLYIGVDDKGIYRGVSNANKLLEDIPNKTIQFLGVVVDVELITESEKNCLIIRIQQSLSPISFKVRYYIRSGSTVQELKGIDKIINGFAKADLPEPQFKEIAGGVEVTMFKHKDVVENVVEDVVENVVENRLQKILNFIKENKQISASEIALKLDVTERTAQRDLNKLKEINKIKRIGPAKGGYWELT